VKGDDLKRQFYKMRPCDCSQQELDSYHKTVLNGGQVQAEGLLQLIKTADWLGFGMIDKKLVSVAAIKQPRKSYRNRVFSESKSMENPIAFNLEYGWAYTVPSCEGLGMASGLADLLLMECNDYIFSTTGVGNLVMKHVLTKRGFVESGIPYKGRDETKVLLVRRARMSTQRCA